MHGEIPTVRDGLTGPTTRGNTHPMMNAIGGTSIHYHAQSWRFTPWDFKVRSSSIQRYGPNSIPKGSTVEDWPIGYDDLEPYYDIIEQEVGVSGRAGNIQGKLTGRAAISKDPAARISHASAARHRFYEPDDQGRKSLGWNPSVVRQRSIQKTIAAAPPAPITAIATAAAAT